MDMTPRKGGRVAADAVVMASIDRGPDGDYLVIADISRDGQWLSVPLAEGLVLAEHR